MEKNEIKDSLSFDIIDVAKNIAKEKGIDEMEVIEAMEMAIAKAGRTKYGFELDIRAHVDKETGKIGLYRYQEVVEDITMLPSEERINKINVSDLKNKSLNLSRKTSKALINICILGSLDFPFFLSWKCIGVSISLTFSFFKYQINFTPIL